MNGFTVSIRPVIALLGGILALSGCDQPDSAPSSTPEDETASGGKADQADQAGDDAEPFLPRQITWLAEAPWIDVFPENLVSDLLPGDTVTIEVSSERVSLEYASRGCDLRDIPNTPSVVAFMMSYDEPTGSFGPVIAQTLTRREGQGPSASFTVPEGTEFQVWFEYFAPAFGEGNECALFYDNNGKPFDGNYLFELAEM